MSLQELLAEQLAPLVEDLPEPTGVNPTLEVGKEIVIAERFPLWAPEQRHDERPHTSIPITTVIDLTAPHAEIVLTEVNYYRQHQGGNPDAPLQSQAEFNIYMPHAKVLLRDEEGNTIPHPLYATDESGAPIWGRAPGRALAAYVKSFFNVPEDSMDQLHEVLMAANFQPIIGTQRDEPSKRDQLWRIGAPVPPNVTAASRELTRQETGFRLNSFTVLAPRPFDQRYNGGRDPEFEGFAWHLAENLRWIAALAKSGHNPTKTYSLATAITGVDSRSADMDRPRGNALRATTPEISYKQITTDAEVLAALELPEGTPVTSRMRAIANIDTTSVVNNVRLGPLVASQTS